MADAPGVPCAAIAAWLLAIRTRRTANLDHAERRAQMSVILVGITPCIAIRLMAVGWDLQQICGTVHWDRVLQAPVYPREIG